MHLNTPTYTQILTNASIQLLQGKQKCGVDDETDVAVADAFVISNRRFPASQYYICGISPPCKPL